MVLLEKVLAENRRLREAIEERDNEQRDVLQKLASKMESGLGQEETHTYHTIKEKLRHSGRMLDLKVKDLIGHL